METGQVQIQTARRLAHEVPSVDTHLPGWARRDNPIVRQHLGMYWRVFPPELPQLAQWFLIQALLIGSTLLIPLIYLPMMVVLLISLAALPVILYIYGQALVGIMRDAAAAMAREYQNDTLDLLRTTPYSAVEIVLSKVSASVWRRMDALTMATAFTVTLGTPIIFMLYVNRFPPEAMSITPHIMALLVMVASVLRLLLEMAMMASLGVLLGAAVRLRLSAFIATMVLAFFYFLLLNLPRLLTLSWPMQLLVDGVLPVLLPLVITYAAVRASARVLTQD